MKQFISLEEAVEILDGGVKQLPKKSVPLLEAVGHRAYEDVCAPLAVPSFNKSAMDGYAVCVDEANSLEEETLLTVIEEVFAGHIGCKTVVKGTATKIMTGAPIPKGANAVIKKEEVIVTCNQITIKTKVIPNQNVCFIGEDVQIGQRLLQKDKKLEYSDIGLLASCGITQVDVYKKPTVALISTGDEVCDIGQSLGAGKIYNSNKYSLLARLKELGFEVVYIDHANDGQELIGQALLKASQVADMVLTTGGVSVGDKDLLQEVVENIGGTKLFWKVLLKPGSAMLCSQVNDKIVISLSGNPTAALTTFELLARPTLEKLSGERVVEIKREKAVLKQAITKSSPQRRFVRGRVVAESGLQEVWVTQTKSGNGILSSTIDSNCIIEIEAGTKGLVEGTHVTIIKL